MGSINGASWNDAQQIKAREDLLTRNHIVMRCLPMPPSSNNQYKLFKRGGKVYHVPSNELKAFKSDIDFWALDNRDIFIRNLVLADQWKKEGVLLEFHAIFYFFHERLFTLSGKPRKKDVSNYIKALHDSVSRLLKIDDCYFFRISAEKREIESHDENEGVSIDIYPIQRI